MKASRETLMRILPLVVAAGAIAVAIVFATLYFSKETSPSRAAAGNSQFDYSILNDVREILARDYVKPENLDDEALFEAAINGMIGLLNDDGTYYVRPNDFKLDTTLTGQFEGIGATISSQNNEIVIISTFKETPAEKAGLKPGDVILAVDGASTKGWTSEKTALTIRGPKGTQVVVSIRHADGKVEEYKLIRSTVQVQSVTTSPPGGVLRDESGTVVTNVGYVQIREFSRRTAQELDDAIKEQISKGAKALIIDVRYNGGGLLSTTLQVADLLLDNGTIAIQRDGAGKETVYSARNGQAASNLPIVLLQNRFSASASEILSSALKDNRRATIVGEKSFGKGTVNTARELANGEKGAVYVSIAHWLTPAGALIDKVGVRPDIEVIPTDEDIDLRRDPQLLRAVTLLQAQVRAP